MRPLCGWVRACVRAHARACVCCVVCARVCVCVYVCVWQPGYQWRAETGWAETLRLWRPRLTVVSEDYFIAKLYLAAADLDYKAFMGTILQFSERVIMLGGTPLPSFREARQTCTLVGDIPIPDLGPNVGFGNGLYKNEVWKRGRCARGLRA